MNTNKQHLAFRLSALLTILLGCGVLGGYNPAYADNETIVYDDVGTLQTPPAGWGGEGTVSSRARRSILPPLAIPLPLTIAAITIRGGL